MSALVSALVRLALDIWRDVKNGKKEDEIKREARERLMVAIDNAAAKERLRQRKGRG